MTEDVSPRVAREIHPIAVRQARERVMLQAFVILPMALLGAMGGVRGGMICFAGTFAVGLVSTVYDFRWWRWVREANPVEAFERLQARTEHEGGQTRQRLTGLVLVATLAAWLYFGR